MQLIEWPIIIFNSFKKISKSLLMNESRQPTIALIPALILHVYNLQARR